MDDTVNRLVKDLADAIAAAVAADPAVAAVQARARAAGYDMRVSLEASVAFARLKGKAVAKSSTTKGVARHQAELVLSANDRRFLRSLRIAPDEFAEEVE
jgi:CRISPR/Cas system CMR subunit Cmr6 (Cas7 group RAMP superfamily)